MLPENIKNKNIQQGEAFQKYLTDLTKDKSKSTHVNYEATVEHAKEMAVHAWGEKPEDILTKARPREETSVTQYRIDSWEPITLSKFDQSISVLQKMFNPKIFSKTFPPQPGGVKLADNETLEDYTTKSYPLYDSVFNFASEVLLKQMIADPNGVIAIVPTNYNLPQNEFQRPFTVLFSSKQVLDEKAGQYFVIKDQETVRYENSKKVGSIIHIFTPDIIYTFEERKDGRTEDTKFVEIVRYEHMFGVLPAWHLGGIVDSRSFPIYYKSFFYPALPDWNKAIRLESDLDGAYVNHLHPKQWEIALDCEYSDHEGNMCKGGSIYHIGKKHNYTCPQCHGTGKASVKSPFDVYQINPDKLSMMDGKSAIIPPSGYVTVPTEIISLLKQTVAEKIESGLSAICMDVVSKVGEVQSGVAKTIDRSELHSFMGKIASYMFDNHIPNIFYFINKYRYGVILGNKVDEYLPIISKPVTFDDLTITEITDEIAKAKESNSNSSYITALEVDAASKRFSTSETLYTQATLTLILNTFPNKSVEEKEAMVFGGTVSKVDVAVSNNIDTFVRRALYENKDFGKMEYNDQMEILRSYAEEVLKTNQTQTEDIIQNVARPVIQ